MTSAGRRTTHYGRGVRLDDDLDDLGGEEVPTVAELVQMIEQGTYDVPQLSERLGLSQRHVRLLLSTVAAEAAIDRRGTI